LALPYRWQWRVERWKNSLRGFFGGRETQPRPKICPSCGALVGINASRCHECGTNLRFSLAAVSKGLSGVFGGHAPVTTILLIANLAMFGVEFMAMAAAGKAGGLAILWGMDGAALYRLGANFGPAIFILHQWWRLVTACFLHGGLIHIGFNLMVLMDFGPPLEELYGSARYFFFYMVCGVCGYLLSALLNNSISIGASGAILGLVGLLLAVTSKRGGSYMRQLRSRLITWVIIIFAVGFMGIMAIDNYAHLGGFAAGFVLGKISADHEPHTPAEKRLAQFLCLLAVVVTVASFALMFLHYRDPLPL